MVQMREGGWGPRILEERLGESRWRRVRGSGRDV